MIACRAIIKMLLLFLQSSNVEEIIASLKVVQRVIQSAAMKEYWLKFHELLLIRVIDCYKNGKEVRRVLYDLSSDFKDLIMHLMILKKISSKQLLKTIEIVPKYHYTGRLANYRTDFCYRSPAYRSDLKLIVLDA